MFLELVYNSLNYFREIIILSKFMYIDDYIKLIFILSLEKFLIITKKVPFQELLFLACYLKKGDK